MTTSPLQMLTILSPAAKRVLDTVKAEADVMEKNGANNAALFALYSFTIGRLWSELVAQQAARLGVPPEVAHANVLRAIETQFAAMAECRSQQAGHA